MSVSSVPARIGDQLLAAGLITQEQLEEALRIQKQSKGFVGDTLVRMGAVPAQLVGCIIAKNLAVPYSDLTTISIDQGAVSELPEEFQRQHLVFPFARDLGKLHLAMVDPLNVGLCERIELRTGMRIQPYLALQDDIEVAFNKSFSTLGAAEEVLKEIAFLEAEDEQEVNDDQLSALAEDAPVIRLVNAIIAGAATTRASDIHIEPLGKQVRVRNRVDGILYDEMTYANHLHNAVVSRIKVVANMNITERRRPQDGRIAFAADGKTFDLRVSTLLLGTGEKVVMRVLDQSNSSRSLESLGFLPEQETMWRGFLQRPHGVVLVTGPTGSGKSTTLYASLNKMNDPSRNITTVEDPIEYQLVGINQSAVQPKIGIDFAATLRTILRQDPDVVMVGEIRDGETAAISIQAALTGHLVFSTLHTNDAASALIRLENLGLERFLINSAVVGVIGQRLLRRVCTYCAVDDRPEQALLDAVGLTAKDVKSANLKVGIGCDRCAGRGYRGRVAVYETLQVSQPLREAFKRGEDGEALKEIARQQGMITMREAGVRRALEGVTTLREVCRVLLLDEDDKPAGNAKPMKLAA